MHRLQKKTKKNMLELFIIMWHNIFVNTPEYLQFVILQGFILFVKNSIPNRILFSRYTFCINRLEYIMKKKQIKVWKEQLKIFLLAVFLIIVLLFIGAYIVIPYYLIGERTDRLDKSFLSSESICDVYDIKLTEEDNIYRLERHSFRDSITYYALYIKPENMEKFTENNRATLSMFGICKNSDYSKRPSLYPCIHYKGSTAVIITTDIRNNNSNEKEYKAVYSDRVADYFDSCYMQINVYE